MEDFAVVAFVNSGKRLEGCGTSVQIGEHFHRRVCPHLLVGKFMILPVMAGDDQDNQILPRVSMKYADNFVQFGKKRAILFSH